MYTPPHFQAKDLEEVKDFIKAHSFAILVSYQENRPIATHIPLLLVEDEEQQVLWGHISKANPQWQNIETQEVLAIFSEPHTYVSSSWYQDPNVPTWNYIAVHAYGQASLLEGAQLYRSVADLVEKYESSITDRFHLADLSEQDLKRQLRGIVGIQIQISRLEASFKLSQNRKPQDHQTIIEKLEKRGDEHSITIAAAMRKNKS